ncbi:MAG1 (YER142C) [Zygosaccharomyces parabailii]|uniref:ZYBA0S05-08130g1_1 n=1 Tax=Zygosaccharomyces bailii (strain CLIB 213 / ATCC 58445 / CBS 680 / BCRC 21525 / NBRC 1098 / NCYC 1416 / NRRL Y-2227) TaxID=1333698 RepID=A0A8J2T8E6_ZYGB2|nr:MAG1 (YER142C) [Zygosaccharomyces parabailii]AQZ13619.1 MAG1 (YER142C) [Zygosaccharomyces parabailii]CDF90062.1 ZYBA0S05-08130g1_1 [Zygosaccharomyces bailii CLIB 213]CDH15249.1 related to DNA-3-methyladenine glycosylase [Zygosaccharomyces bailii ISA1307]SJM87296.1 related to DNA-3-methyladenine glycosylase [Zygosaccharomyces bailii]
MKRPLDNDEQIIKPETDVSSMIPKSFTAKHSAAFNEACKHILSIDKSLLDIILKGDFPLFLKDREEYTLQHYYEKLASAIMSQQISGAAAKSIKRKLIDHFEGVFPSYAAMREQLSKPETRQDIKSCGFSARKLDYIESLTSYFFEKEDQIANLFSDGADDDIVEQLTKNIKGVGPWSAKMFLLTGLARMDVFSIEDLGIARGFSKYLSDKPLLVEELKRTRVAAKRSKIKHKKLNWIIYDDDLMESYATRFSPYRSVLMFIFWRLGSTNVDAMAKTEKDFVSN